jgi:hypothetical protein
MNDLLEVAFAKVWAKGILKFREWEVDGTGDRAECDFIRFSDIYNQDVLAVSSLPSFKLIGQRSHTEGDLHHWAAG